MLQWLAKCNFMRYKYVQRSSECKNCFAKHFHPQLSVQVVDSNFTRKIPALAVSNTASISLWRPRGKSGIGIVCSLLRHCLWQGMHITRSIITFADFQVVILPKYCPVYNHTQLCELTGSVLPYFPQEHGSSFRWKFQASDSVTETLHGTPSCLFSGIHFSSWSDKAHPIHPQETTESKAAPRLYPGVPVLRAGSWGVREAPVRLGLHIFNMILHLT